MMTAGRQCGIAGGVASLLLAIFMCCTYRKFDSHQLVEHPSEQGEALFKIGIYGSAEDNREVVLPPDFQSQSRPGDRLEKVHHWFESSGWRVCLLEATLWRDVHRVASW